MLISYVTGLQDVGDPSSRDNQVSNDRTQTNNACNVGIASNTSFESSLADYILGAWNRGDPRYFVDPDEEQWRRFGKARNYDLGTSILMLGTHRS